MSIISKIIKYYRGHVESILDNLFFLFIKRITITVVPNLGYIYLTVLQFENTYGDYLYKNKFEVEDGFIVSHGIWNTNDGSLGYESSVLIIGSGREGINLTVRSRIIGSSVFFIGISDTR